MLEEVGLPGVVEGEIYCIVEVAEHVYVVETELQVDRMGEIFSWRKFLGVHDFRI